MHTQKALWDGCEHEVKKEKIYDPCEMCHSDVWWWNEIRRRNGVKNERNGLISTHLPYSSRIGRDSESRVVHDKTLSESCSIHYIIKLTWLFLLFYTLHTQNCEQSMI